MDTPRAVRSRITLNSASTSVAESADVGSSMIRMRLLTDRARAISTICCCPRRRSSTKVSGSIASSSSAISARVRLASSAKSTPVAPRNSRPMKTLSRTERFGARLSSWWMIEMPRSRASAADARTTGTPSSTMSPDVGVTTPERIFISVDLPAPFSPNSVVTCPRWMSKFTPLSACTLPYDLAMFRADSTIALSGCRATQTALIARPAARA
ncbi:hypothetical protein FQZ97_684480 [compost metagenome]